MDEPTSSLAEREVQTLFRVIRRLRERGHRGRLRLPPARRAVRGLRPGHGAARRPDRARPADGRARPATSWSRPCSAASWPSRARGGRHAAPPSGRRAAVLRGARLRRGTRCSTCRSTCAPGEVVGPGRACSGSGRTETARALFGARPARRRRGHRRRATPSVRLAAGRHPGAASASLRGPQGRGHHPRPVRPREHRRWPLLPRLARRGIVDRRAQRPRSSTVHRGGFGIKSAGAGPADPRTVGRQPAEGAARPLAVHATRSCSSSTSRPAASTSAPSPRSRSWSTSSPTSGLAVLLISSELEELIERLPTASSCCATARSWPSSRARRSPRSAACTRWPGFRRRWRGRRVPREHVMTDDCGGRPPPGPSMTPDRGDGRRRHGGRSGTGVAAVGCSGRWAQRSAPWCCCSPTTRSHPALPAPQSLTVHPVATGRSGRDRRGRHGRRDRHRRHRPLRRFGDGDRGPGRGLADVLDGGRSCWPSRSRWSWPRPVRASSTAPWWPGFGVQPIIATLILFIAGRGIAQLISGGKLTGFRNPTLQLIGLGRIAASRCRSC